VYLICWLCLCDPLIGWNFNTCSLYLYPNIYVTFYEWSFCNWGSIDYLESILFSSIV